MVGVDLKLGDQKKVTLLESPATEFYSPTFSTFCKYMFTISKPHLQINKNGKIFHHFQMPLGLLKPSPSQLFFWGICHGRWLENPRITIGKREATTSSVHDLAIKNAFQQHSPGPRFSEQKFRTNGSKICQVIQALTFLGWWKRDPFKGLSNLQLGDEKGTAWITWCFFCYSLMFFFQARIFFGWGLVSDSHRCRNIQIENKDVCPLESVKTKNFLPSITIPGWPRTLINGLL